MHREKQEDIYMSESKSPFKPGQLIKWATTPDDMILLTLSCCIEKVHGGHWWVRFLHPRTGEKWELPASLFLPIEVSDGI